MLISFTISQIARTWAVMVGDEDPKTVTRALVRGIGQPQGQCQARVAPQAQEHARSLHQRIYHHHN